MKIIAVGDIHMATENFEATAEFASADVVILNGDLTNYGGKNEVKQVLDKVMAVNPNVLAQFGNLDKPEINTYLEDLGMNIHAQARLVEGTVAIVGIGGSNRTPFNTPSEFAESEILAKTKAAYQEALDYVSLAEPLHKRRIPIILVSHTPPYHTAVDRIHSGKHVGSTAIRTIIEKFQPALCITGHIHEAKGEDTIGNTPIVNPGMFGRGGRVSITIEESQLTVELQ